jgi:GT2 family glycosyltransferase
LRSWGDRLERILVVDDHSPGEPDLPEDPRLTVRVNEARRGFAATLNRGIEEVGTDIVAIFDADAYPLGDTSEAICDAFAGQPALGMVGFRTVDADGVETPSWSEEPSSVSLAVGQRLDGWLRRLRPAHKRDRVCLHAAALALRREAFVAVEGADEQLGFLDVDIDLSMRLRRAGWLVQWEPSWVAFHQGGGSGVATRWRVQEFYRSRFRLLRKHQLARFPGLLRATVLARLRLEFLALAAFGALLVRDAAQRRDKLEGRRELIGLVRRGLG